MKHLLFALLLILASCSGKAPQETTNDDYDVIGESSTTTESVEPDTIPPFAIKKTKSGRYNVLSIEENPRKVNELTGPYYYETCPNGLYDKPISKSKAKLLKDAPVSYRDATWGAAYRALRNMIPVKESKIIFDYSKFNRQINNENECLFFGSVEIKDEKGKYVPAEVSIIVRWIVPQDFREPSGWYCAGNIVY